MKKKSKKEQKDIPTVVWGLGNPILSDDGIGVIIAKILKRLKIKNTYVFVCETTPENYIKPTLKTEAEKLIIIDAVNMNKPPGTIEILLPNQISHQDHFYTHKRPLKEILQQLKPRLKDIKIVGIQPKSVSLGTKLSNEVKKAKKKALLLLIDMLKS